MLTHKFEGSAAVHGEFFAKSDVLTLIDEEMKELGLRMYRTQHTHPEDYEYAKAQMEILDRLLTELT